MQSDIMLAIEHQNFRKQVFIVQVSSLFLVASAFLSFTGKCKLTLELLLAYYNRLNLKYNGSSLVFVFTVCLYFFTIFSQQQLRDFYHCPWLPKKIPSIVYVLCNCQEAFIGTMFTAHIIFENFCFLSQFQRKTYFMTMLLLKNRSLLILGYVLMFRDFYFCPELIASKQYFVPNAVIYSLNATVY